MMISEMGPVAFVVFVFICWMVAMAIPDPAKQNNVDVGKLAALIVKEILRNL